MIGCLLIVAFLAAEPLLAGWLLMLAVGVAHADWWPAVPTISYWPAVTLAALLSAAFAASCALTGVGGNERR